ncbi:MAG: hypothetical protein EP332_05225 [Bacteroidetes bacterium]|nr:MAG: hypothetical protein EP332_05225 [Bacteroidota bacterium]
MNSIGTKLFALFLTWGILSNCIASAQVYMEKQSRHRFAQLTLGLDLLSTHGGSSRYQNAQMQTLSQSWSAGNVPRFMIGGTHFWGHAHFALSIPLVNPSKRQAELRYLYYTGIETAFQYYPWRIQSKRVRPFLGISFLNAGYQQATGTEPQAKGAYKEMVLFPVQTGLCYAQGPHHLEFGLSYNYQHQQRYALSKQLHDKLQLAPWTFRVSYRYNLETTLSAEKSWENGKSQLAAAQLAKAGKLNNFFLGIGLSSAFQLRNSPLNVEHYPWLERFPTPLMPDMSLGYYWHEPDMQLVLNYRFYRSKQSGYGIRQQIKRNSLGLELTKCLGDYHGFVPFLGPLLSMDMLAFEAFQNDVPDVQAQDTKLAFGLSFGWDIRPNRIQSWLLRTNLRWYPKLQLGTERGKVDFSSLEFNFIQLVLFPGRF